MSALRYCVLETWTDGTKHVWGPFSEHRAEMAADALRTADHGMCLESARVLVIKPSARLDYEYPDWKRGVRV